MMTYYIRYKDKYFSRDGNWTKDIKKACKGSYKEMEATALSFNLVEVMIVGKDNKKRTAAAR